MRNQGKLPTWLERRGYSSRLKRLLARHAARRRPRPRPASPGGERPFRDNVVPFPVRLRLPAVL